MSSVARDRVGLAELVALLSLGTDLGLGQPMEHMIRACLIALRLGERLGLTESERGVVYYSGLLAWVGCHTDAYEQAKWFGDDTTLKRDAHYLYDMGRVGPAISFVLTHVGGPERSPAARTRVGMAFIAEGRRAMRALAENHYRATDELVERLDLGEDVRKSLRQTYERWDGRGAYGMRGEEIALSSRLINLADVVEVFARAGGVEAAITVARERSGTQFDPELVDAFCDQAPIVLAELDHAPSWEAVIAAEPALGREIAGEELDRALESIGEFAELKSPDIMGHVHAVRGLVTEAATSFGLPDADLADLRRAACVYDLGRLGVPNTVWDKPGPLTRSELERVRTHPYLGERMLAFAPSLDGLGRIAVQHHERLDGSGYPRGLSGDQIEPTVRLLAAADVYQALREPRPHRPARAAQDAAGELRREVTAGRLDGDAVDSVLRAAGHKVGRRREWPAGLTTRELEVLRLLARGLSNKQIAAELVISPKTAGSHVEHIYRKIDASNRAQASLFALRHGLMRGAPAPDDA
ncbi:HD domain-containing phosphohydrolase [Solirubrobacter soli]|uniref:HD domain-containing phosphohydrolase n=1 Tax=Solirubrobacter soli TaxID=363832 RepID=UPI000416B8DB|nr:HD domain-containing phosphohydrolase [Solirubrobacter soli]